MTDRDELLERFRTEAENAGWWRQNQGVVAAVSGGPDSMALLHLLRSLSAERSFPLLAAHVNHRFRGAEAEAEAELAGRTAEEWGIPFRQASIDVPAYIEETGMNAQAAARSKRYEFLAETAASFGASHLALGHHADDQAETVLMRMLRGTGIGGLAGMPAHRKEGNLELIRPLLRITKGELLAYCERNGVPYAQDSSNASRYYFRNEVRLDLIPMLEKYNPKLRESLIRLSDTAAADDEYMESQTEAAFSRTAVRSGGGFRLDRRLLQGLHVALQRRLIKLILKYCSEPGYFLEHRQIGEMLDALDDRRPSMSRIDIGDGKVFVREYDEVFIGNPSPAAKRYRAEVVEFPSVFSLGDSGRNIEFERLDGDFSLPPEHRWEAFFDESDLALPLVVRSREPGDRLEPAGLNGTKKVQDMFVDAKVPRSRRDDWPLLCDAAGRILWIPGLRRSMHAVVHAGTKSTIRAAVWPEDPPPGTRPT
jgi:tRNA(Ile)-lysidine synthase